MLGSRPKGHLAACLLALVAILGAVVAVSGDAEPAAAYPGAPWFQPNRTYDQNFPDPAIIEVGGTYYAYATTTGGASLPVMSSTDLVNWTARGDALGTGPSWSPVGPGGWNLWAPTVVELPGGGFMAAFASPTGSGNRRCIATAHASSPLGPFVASGTAPFVCEPDPNGALDPFLVVDDGVPWLIWKNEGVPVGHPTLAPRRTGFWARALADDGRAWRPGSTTHQLLETTEWLRPWQGTVIENPALVEFEGRWLLLYSANDWDSDRYAMGYAVCSSPAGPCSEPGVGPLAASDARRLGPGAPAPIVGPTGHLHVGYQGWNPPYTSYPAYPQCLAGGTECTSHGQRFLFVDRACVVDTSVTLFVDDGRGFCDVAPGAFFEPAVDWLATEGITLGLTATAFGSAHAVDRAQMAVFLWRLMGEPQPSAPAAFVDVPAGAYYADAVAWLVAEGVTAGVTPDRFDPSGAVTRAQMAVFLWRLAGRNAGPPPAGFVDVPAGAWFAPATGWLVDRGVTGGTTPVTYSPGDLVTRAQMGAFLCRLSNTADYADLGAPTPAC